MVWLSVGNGRSCRLRFGNQHDGYKEVWPFFVIGFVVAAISQLTLIALGALGVALALIYLNLLKWVVHQIMEAEATLVTL